ncbi:MAG: magnesium transporter [Scytonema sp. RU_4_4]|nr:magnesium transporter [Scytonema sp. RU_4_4]NJR73179.1 magnesium transporter [Scytonema sp. CRU_2_7]
MQPDLLSLEMTKGELRRLIGLDPDDVFRPSIIKNREKRFRFLMNEIVVVLVLTSIIVGFIYAFMILPTIGPSILLGIILLTSVPIAIIIGRWFWRRFTRPRTLTVLLDEVDKYHGVIKAIDIHDQLVTSGNTESHITDREKVVTALLLIREDFVRALKTERILRDNKKLFTNNQELLVNNFTDLQLLQVSNQAGEYAQLLNQSLQIAMTVQAEMTRFHKV